MSYVKNVREKTKRRQLFFEGDEVWLKQGLEPGPSRGIIVEVESEGPRGHQYHVRNLNSSQTFVAREASMKLAKRGQSNPLYQSQSPSSQPEPQRTTSQTHTQTQKDDEYAWFRVDHSFQPSWTPEIRVGDRTSDTGILQLYCPDPPTSFDFDVVLVHGLGGSAVESWRDKKHGTIWPRTLLPKDFPTSRVLSFGYNPASTTTNRVLDLSRLARRLIQQLQQARRSNSEKEKPLVFIAHSFGGLIVKEVVNLLPQIDPILLKSIAHIVFLGVVHDVESEDFITRWREIVQRSVSSRRVQSIDITASMQSLRTVSAEFSENAKIDNLISIAEELEVKLADGRKVILVPPSASVLKTKNKLLAPVYVSSKTHDELPIVLETTGEEDEPDIMYLQICRLFRQILARNSDSQGPDIQAYIASHFRPSFLQSSEYYLLKNEEIDKRTTEWVFDVEPFQRWKESSSGLLFIQGRPGCGKSTLAAFIVHHLAREQPNRIVLNFFFDLKCRSTKETMLLGLIYQLSQINEFLVQDALRQLGLRDIIYELTQSDTLLHLFLSCLHQLQGYDLVIAIDAIDECNGEPAEILSLIRKVVARTPNTKAILVSRFPEDLNSNEILLEMSEFRDRITDVVVRSDITQLLMKSYPDAPMESVREISTFLINQIDNAQFRAKPILSYVLNQNPRIEEVVGKVELFISDGDNVQYQLPGLISFISASKTPLEKSLKREILGIFTVAEGGVTRESMYHDGELGKLFRKETIQPDRLAELMQDLDSYEDVPHLVQDEVIAETCYFVIGIGLSTLKIFEESSTENPITLSTTAKAMLQSPEYLGLGGFDVQHEHWKMTRRCIFQLSSFFGGPEGSPEEQAPPQISQVDFTSYAARTWMYHYRFIEASVDDVTKNFAYDLLRVEGMLARWAKRYEDLTQEYVPRPSEAAVLFGAAAFGLITLVNKALGNGKSPLDTDEHQQTPLHWACNRGHCAVIEPLLLAGADIDGQNISGMTPLHLATQKGYDKVINNLLDHGADINKQTFDGFAPLHLAVQSEEFEIAKLLVQRGADITSVTYTSTDLTKMTDESTLAALLEQISITGSDMGRFVNGLISSNSQASIMSLMRARPDIIGARFPWTTELLDEGYSLENVSDWLLKSENLHWVEADFMPQGKYIPHLVGHVPDCAHDICIKSKLESVSQPTEQKGEEDQAQAHLPMASVPSSPSESSFGDLGELEKHFHILESREEMVLNVCGVAGIFPPTWPHDMLNPGVASLKGGMAQIIYGNSENFAFFPLPSIVTSTRALPGSEEQIQEGSLFQLQEDRLLMSRANSILSLDEFETTSMGSYDSYRTESNFELWDQSLAKRTLKALENVLEAFSRLNKAKGCCTSFSLLTYHHDRPKVLSLSLFHHPDLVQLCSELKQYCEPTDKKAAGWTNTAAEVCIKIFQELGWSDTINMYLSETKGRSGTYSPASCIHVAALIAQIMSVALVTYTRGHSREFRHSHLSRSVEVFQLRGVGFGKHMPMFVAERVGLDCLGDMLKRPVWMFRLQSEQPDFSVKFAVTASIQNLLDLWGGSITRSEDNTEFAVAVGGGHLVKSDANNLASNSELLCHWTDEDYGTFLPSDAELLIGATTVNSECPLTRDICHEQVQGSLNPLGTKSPEWKIKGQSFGLSGGKIVNASYSVNVQREDGISRKQRIMEAWKGIHALTIINEPVGLELSLCTGVGRRVPLRRLFYGEVLEHIQRIVPGLKSITADHLSRFSQSMSNQEFSKFVEELSKEEVDAFEAATEVFLFATEKTGITKDGHLLLWWPERGVVPRGLKIDRGIYSGPNPWLPILKDSESCAVFALATCRCLEHGDLRECPRRGANGSNLDGSILSAKIVLDTHLSPVNRTKKIGTVTIQYELNQRLELWPQKEILRVTRVPAPLGKDGVIRLQYGARMPSFALREISRMSTKRWPVVREQQMLEDRSQNVLINSELEVELPQFKN